MYIVHVKMKKRQPGFLSLIKQVYISKLTKCEILVIKNTGHTCTTQDMIL